MARIATALLAGLLLFPGTARAAEPAAGNWKVTFLDDSDQRLQTFWIVKLDRADGKWTGSVIATAEGLPPAKLEDLSVTGEKVGFSLRLGEQSLVVEGKPAADGKKVFGL